MGTVPVLPDARGRDTVRIKQAREGLTLAADVQFDIETSVLAELNRKNCSAARRSELLKVLLHTERALGNLRVALGHLNRGAQA